MTPKARRILAVVVVVVISLVIMKFSLWLGVIALVAGLAGARVGPFSADRLGRERWQPVPASAVPGEDPAASLLAFRRPAGAWPRRSRRTGYRA